MIRVEILSSELTGEEIDKFVAPKSTSESGINCAALALYGIKLIPADFVKYYSDGLVEVLRRYHGDLAIVADVDRAQVPNIEEGQGVSHATIVSNLHSRVRSNLKNSGGVGMYDTAFLFPAMPGGRRPTSTRFRYLLKELPVGRAINISFEAPANMPRMRGSHSVILWKRAEKDAWLIDFQRGTKHAGKHALELYAKWQASGSVLGQNTAVSQSALGIHLPPELYDTAEGIESTFVEYAIRQGIAWGYYGSGPDAETSIRAAGGPVINVFISYYREGFPITVRGFSHQNEQLTQDKHTPLFLEGFKEAESRMEDINDPRKFFDKFLGRAPVEIQKRTDLKFYRRDPGTTYMIDPGTLKGYRELLGETETSYFISSINTEFSSGGKRSISRRLPSLPKRKDPSLASRKRRTRRRPKSRS